jgi:ABC-type transporter Mla maintaining outer membrane lipid asymmetry ATPase subunit MlaF
VGPAQIDHVRADERAGGVRSRAALARPTAHGREVWLLDARGAGLYPLAADAMRPLGALLRHRLELTVLLVSRDARWALPIADHVAILRGGRIVTAGRDDDVCASADPAVRQLLAARAVGPLAP